MTSAAASSSPAPPPPPSRESISTLDVDLPCVRCNYDLRTQSSLGRCPECEAPVSWSLQGDLCVRPVTYWSYLQCFGCLITAVGVAWLVIGVTGMVWNSVDPPWVALFLDAAMFLGALGLLMLGWPERNSDSPNHAWFYRPAMWGLGVLVLVTTLADQESLRQISPRLAMVWIDYREFTMTMILRAAWVIAIAYLRRMAPRFDAESLVPETYLFLFGVLMAVAGQWAASTGMPVLGIKPPNWWMSAVRWLWLFQGLWAITLFMRYGWKLRLAQRAPRPQPLPSP